MRFALELKQLGSRRWPARLASVQSLLGLPPVGRTRAAAAERREDNYFFANGDVLIRCGSMKSKMGKNRVQLQPFESGQVWQMESSHLEIGLIGKTLVHYKHYKGEMKRSPVSLLNKDALERFLRENQAVLIQPQPANPRPATGGRRAARIVPVNNTRAALAAPATQLLRGPAATRR